jgi:hypothetical protein
MVLYAEHTVSSSPSKIRDVLQASFEMKKGVLCGIGVEICINISISLLANGYPAEYAGGPRSIFLAVRLLGMSRDREGGVGAGASLPGWKFCL